jgi:hypothetical protein
VKPTQQAGSGAGLSGAIRSHRPSGYSVNEGRRAGAVGERACEERDVALRPLVATENMTSRRSLLRGAMRRGSGTNVHQTKFS